MRLFTACALLTAVVVQSVYAGGRELPDVESGHWPTQYDGYFRKYSKRYFGPHFDWRWFKAQAIAESNLRPDAVSPVGAKGLMQIMPATYLDIKKANPHFLDLTEPRWNIAAGIYYDRMLYRKWQKRISEHERLMLAFASYNAGLGNILRAYKRSPPPVTSWEDIAPRAPSETRGYVKRIRKLKDSETKRSGSTDKGVWKLLSRQADKES